MNQDRVRGICMQCNGSLKKLAGKLIGNPRAVAAGANDQFAGRILEQRGISMDEADRQLKDFLQRNRNWNDLTVR